MRQMTLAKRKISGSVGSFIIGGSYLAGAAVNFLFFEKRVGAILLVMGALDMLIGLAARRKEQNGETVSKG